MLMIRFLAPDARRDESGAYSIFFAIIATLLLGVGALAVDMGNAYQRRAETQSQADLAALSAAPSLTNHATAVSQVLKYLKANTKAGQAGNLATLSTANLTDGNVNNGEVTFPSQYMMKVVTPQALVEFGLAKAMSKSGVNVLSTATVGVGSPGAPRTMPFYAVKNSGCDYGTQTLTDPANGKAKTAAEMAGVTLAPPTTDPTSSSNSTLTDASPYQFDVGTTGTITLTGSQLSAVTRIGFFRTPTETPNVFEEAITVNTNNNQISAAPVPTDVTNYAGVWWIRVYKPNGNKGWSPVVGAIPIRVGDGPIECAGVSSSGNFGTLKLARSTATSTWAPDNIALGLESPLSLVGIDPTYATQIPQCTPGSTGVVYTPTTSSGVTRLANTNCVDTDTGLTSNVTTQGLVTGTGSGAPGRLVGATTSTVPGRQCGPGHTTASRTMLSKTLNDDTLSCFMTNPAAPLSSIASGSYNAGPALDPAIYDSPRFGYVPVVSTMPTSGGSNHYAIVEMRPAFITSESNASTYTTQQFVDGTSATTTNGLTIPVNKVTSLRVFLFNSNALPNSGGNVIPGTVIDPHGPLVSVLTD